MGLCPMSTSSGLLPWIAQPLLCYCSCFCSELPLLVHARLSKASKAFADHCYPEKTWLLIYDNAEDEQLLRGYWPTGATGSILLTSRHWGNIQQDEYRNGQTVPLFNPQERWDLLMKLLGLQWQNQYLEGQTGALERKAGTRLLDHLGGLTLAIVQAASLIKEVRVTGDQSIQTLLQLFEDSRAKLPPRQIG